MPNNEIINYGQRFDAIYFTMHGEVNLYNKNKTQFMILPQRAVFGDYSILFDVKSVISFRAKYYEEEEIYSK